MDLYTNELPAGLLPVAHQRTLQAYLTDGMALQFDGNRWIRSRHKLLNPALAYRITEDEQ
jgi:hypothetical protein